MRRLAFASATAAGRCAACGEPQPLGGVICPRCAGDAREVDDTLVVVQGDERAYVRVPGAVAPAVVDRLAAEGCRARAVAASRAWTAIPAHTWTLLGAMLVSGFAAAQVVPTLWVATSAGVAVLLAAAEQAIRRPRVTARDDDGAPELPVRLRRTVTEALESLPSGEARHLLADLVRRARPLIAALQRRPDDRRILGDVSDLVDAACAIAAELDRVGAFLARAGAAPSAAVSIRCDSTRQVLVRRLADAGAAIDGLYAQLLQEGSAASDRVAELASELSTEALARREAAKELDAFLRRTGQRTRD